MSQREQAIVTITIGGLPITVRANDASFASILHKRYAGYVSSGAEASYLLEADIVAAMRPAEEVELEVHRDGDEWLMDRGDFRARWNPQTRRGVVTQSANPYSIDSALRIIHSLELAKVGGFLLHAASAIRGNRAFLFSGVSGAGKTTITRLAPADAIRLTDEISYIRPVGGEYRAFGTPFSGELGVPGENSVAPLAALYFLTQGPENRIAPISRESAVSKLLRNILFFAHDEDLTSRVFRAACDFVENVEVAELIFRPEPEVWSLMA